MVLLSREEFKQAVRPALSTTALIVAAAVILPLIVRRLVPVALIGAIVAVAIAWVYQIWQVKSFSRV